MNSPATGSYDLAISHGNRLFACFDSIWSLLQILGGCELHIRLFLAFKKKNQDGRRKWSIYKTFRNFCSEHISTCSHEHMFREMRHLLTSSAEIDRIHC